MLANAVTAVSDFLWGWPLIIILFGTHIFMTIRTGLMAIPNIIAVLLLSTSHSSSLDRWGDLPLNLIKKVKAMGGFASP